MLISRIHHFNVVHVVDCGLFIDHMISPHHCKYILRWFIWNLIARIAYFSARVYSCSILVASKYDNDNYHHSTNSSTNDHSHVAWWWCSYCFFCRFLDLLIIKVNSNVAGKHSQGHIAFVIGNRLGILVGLFLVLGRNTHTHLRGTLSHRVNNHLVWIHRQQSDKEIKQY